MGRKPRRLKEMMDLSGFPEELAPMVQDYSINLLEIRKYPYLERFQTDIRYVFGFCRRQKRKKNWHHIWKKTGGIFSSLDEAAYDLIAVMSKTSQLKQLKRFVREKKGNGYV